MRLSARKSSASRSLTWTTTSWPLLSHRGNSMTDYVAPGIVPAVPAVAAEDERVALAAEPEPVTDPAYPEMRECLTCGGAGPAGSMFDAGYGWYCPTADYAGCRRRRDANRTAARSSETAAEPRREVTPRRRASRRKSPVPKIVAGTTADEPSPVAPAATPRSTS